MLVQHDIFSAYVRKTQRKIKFMEWIDNLSYVMEPFNDKQPWTEKQILNNRLLFKH